MRKEAVKETVLSFACKRCGYFQPITKEEERLLEHINTLFCIKCNYADRDLKRLKDFSYATREIL